jgi:GNAT superfamily N-acetyltransferase
MPSYVIEEVRDVRAAWAELEPLIAGIIEYHRPWDARTLRRDWRERVQDYMARGPQFVTLIVRHEAGSAVGFLSGFVERDYGIFEEPFSFIDNIFLQEDARRNGAGAALVEQFEAWSRQKGAADVQLHVSAQNVLGQAFWNREGYRPVEYILRKPLGAST